MNPSITISPKEIYQETIANIFANTIPLFESSPGIGKSAIIHQVAKDLNLELIDVRLSSYLPEDLNGLPIKRETSFEKNGKTIVKNIAEFIPYSVFPTEDIPIPEGKNGWLLFLDEFNSMSKSVQAAVYKLLLDRMVGQQKLSKYVKIVAAGNTKTDRAIVNTLSTAIVSRVVKYAVSIDAAYTEEWIKWAIKNDIDPSVVGYLSWKKESISTFNPNKEDEPFACPRTWENVSKHFKARTKIEKYYKNNISISVDDMYYRIYGSIGTIANEFIAFTKIYSEFPNIKEIINNPLLVKLPERSEHKYAFITYLAYNIKNYKDNNEAITRIVQCVNRFSTNSPEFVVLFVRMVLQIDISFYNNEEIKKIAINQVNNTIY